MLARMPHPCPCCGHRTLPARGDYDLCPVCRWEDEPGEPWEVSGANATTLVEAQQQLLRDRRPFVVRRLRGARVRKPRRSEARDPGWAPYVWNDELERRVADAHREWEESFAAEPDPEELARAEAELEAWNADYRAALDELRTDVPRLTHREVRARLRALTHDRGLMVDDAIVELWSRQLRAPDWPRGHPAQAAWWLVRHARPRSWRQRVELLRTGTARFAG
jgi:hypothetical protein